MDGADAHGILRGVFDLGDVGELESLVERGAHDGVRLVGLELPIRPADGSEGDVHVTTQANLFLRHGDTSAASYQRSRRPRESATFRAWSGFLSEQR